MQVSMNLKDEEISNILNERVPERDIPAIEFRPGIRIYVNHEEIATKLQEEIDSIVVASSMLYNMHVEYKIQEENGEFEFIIKFTVDGTSRDKYRFVLETDSELNLQTVVYQRRDHRNDNLYDIASGDLETTIQGLGNIKDPGFFTPLEEFRTKVLKIKERAPRDPNMRNVKFMSREFKVPKEEYQSYQDIMDEFVAAIKKASGHPSTSQTIDKTSDTIELELSSGYTTTYKGFSWYNDYMYPSNNWGYGGTPPRRRSFNRKLILTLDKHRRLLSSKVEISEFYGHDDKREEVNTLDFNGQVRWIIDNAL